MSLSLSRLAIACSAITLCLTMSGCISSDGIAPQDRALSANTLLTDEALKAAVVDAHWPDSQWWRSYGDVQLNSWIAGALRDSPTLAEAAARVRQAKALAGITQSAESVQATGKASITRHKWPKDDFYGPGTLSDTTDFDNNATLGLSYSLDLWGRESNASERDLDTAHSVAAQARMAQLELEGNIVRAYVQLSLQFAQRDIAQASLQQQQQILELAQKRFAGGIGTQLEVSQASTSLPEAQRQIDALDEDIALSRNQLAALAGKGPGAGSQLQRPTLALSKPLALPSRLPAELLGQRPDVVAAKWRVAAQARSIDVAHAGFYPDIDLVASIGFSGVGGGALEFLTASKIGGSIGPALSLPIFDGGRLRSQLGAASAGYDAAVAQYNQTLVNSLKDISDQLIKRTSLQSQEQLAGKSVDQARKTYDIATVAYKRGLTGYLEVLNAQTLLLRQQQVQQQIQAARLQTQASLVIALGGGASAGSDTPTREQTDLGQAPLAKLLHQGVAK